MGTHVSFLGHGRNNIATSTKVTRNVPFTSQAIQDLTTVTFMHVCFCSASSEWLFTERLAVFKPLLANVVLWLLSEAGQLMRQWLSYDTQNNTLVISDIVLLCLPAPGLRSMGASLIYVSITHQGYQMT